MNYSFLDKLKHYPYRRKAKQLLFETPIEIMIGILLVGSITGGLTYRNRAAKAGEIPLAFSEIEQTTKEFERAGQPVPPLTRFYSVNNEVAMKVFESNNIAYSLGGSHQVFARELETRVDPALKVHPLISEYAKDFPQTAQDALRSLDKLTQAAAELPKINNAFARSWDEDHDDVYHTEYYTTTSCDSKGQCTTTTHSRQVYDYTIHTYDYYPQHGAAAARMLIDFLAKHPDLNIEERLYLAKMTHADNEYAIEKSMREKFDGKAPSPADYVQLANTWATGSNLTKYLPLVTSHHSSLSNLSPAWNAATRTAKSTRYRTYSSSDAGPREFQIAESALGHGQAIEQSALRITEGIRFSGQRVPELDAKIKEFIGVTLDGKPGDPDKLRDEVMKMARDIYEKNYENGFDVQPFKWLEVVLFTILGMVAGGLAGAGADRLLHARRYDWYTREDQRHIDFDRPEVKPSLAEEMTKKAARQETPPPEKVTVTPAKPAVNDDQAPQKPKGRKIQL